MDFALTPDNLLQPISHASPSGDDLRYGSIYDQIKEARRADDMLEQGEWQTEVKNSDWREVIKLCREALTTQTKDLQIAVWLTEAMIHQYGFAGLATGLELIRRLIQDFWPTLYPPIEDGDLDYRIGPLAFLNERLSDSIYEVPLCDPIQTNGYNYRQWEESRLVGVNRNLDKEQRQRRETLIGEGKISPEEFAVSINTCSMMFYSDIIEQLRECGTAAQDLDTVLNEKFAPDPPDLTQMIAAIEACARIVGRIFKDKHKSEIAPQEEIEVGRTPGFSQTHLDTFAVDPVSYPAGMPLPVCNAISDISSSERWLWKQVLDKLEQGHLKNAMDQLLSAAALAPSIREKARYQLLVAKLCLKADRVDLAGPIVEELHKLIETLNLEKWEHPSWVAEVVETLYRCLSANGTEETDRTKTLFEKLCLLNVTRAAAYRRA
jgi:type VI secretion system protein ImpA